MRGSHGKAIEFIVDGAVIWRLLRERRMLQLKSRQDGRGHPFHRRMSAWCVVGLIIQGECGPSRVHLWTVLCLQFSCVWGAK